ncbi:L-Ala-D/L-amino acid epimerase-like [Eucalyptus grandis]|uniref:L-Ala-D/L-amino acid epimerase-like n=1 Tax=Eucalyptus grandis TaxID=71139 RepID=UPI00192E7BE6|nr:L-Ala-D/L-amino acid epimerase-like [Eucalyptus grandis]
MLASNLSLPRSVHGRPKDRNFPSRARAYCGPVAPPRPAPVVLGFGSLMETFVVEVRRAESRALDVPLAAPFTIATLRLERMGNEAVRVELRNGCAGWGDEPVLPSVTAEEKAREACEVLRRNPAMALGRALGEIAAILPGHEFASVQAGVEMALIDAVANSIGTPLWKLSGGALNTLTT